jgi:hypothetical protein
MSRDPLVAELVDRLVEIRCAGLLRENRELRERLAAERRRPAQPPLASTPAPRPLFPRFGAVAPARPRLRLLDGGAAEEVRR